MTSWYETYKPVGSSRLQLWLAGAIWSGVGLALLFVGTYWLLAEPDYKILILLIIVAACLGYGKSWLILSRESNSLVERIRLRGEDRCAGGFFPLRIWAIVAVMMIMGRLIRSTGIPRPVLGMIYAAVGVGMLISSRVIWLGWKNQSKVKATAVESSKGE